jgi:5-methylcytosine-specific restriction protein B
MMNTADRSLAMIDYALRRRFSFFDMRPGFDSDGFKKYQAGLKSKQFDDVIEAIKQLNVAIEKDDSLGAGFCIGHSYFCNQTEYSKQWMQNVIMYDIKPMLEEYWFDNRDKSRTQIDNLKALLND